MASASEHTTSLVPSALTAKVRKHILSLELGATENAAAVKSLFTRLRDQGLPTDRKYLFVIDGAKALRAGIEEVFGSEQPVQRCRNHKMRNVLDELPREQHAQALNMMRAAWQLTDADQGVKKLEQLARFLEHITNRRPGVFAKG
jgi:transposase-like protein